MSENNNQINIARIIYNAYPHSDLLPIEPDTDCSSFETLFAKVTNENIGDGLFEFIVTEIVEGGESTLDGAIRVTEQAREDIDSVLHALYSADNKQNSRNNNLTPVEIKTAIKLLEACRNITSYTMDLLYKLDNQVNYEEIEEIQHARNAITRFANIVNITP